mmetsp:Transcript_38023/g.73654  ORF Transcript_38023/g.73654 Transcript_38023/m.73654 type:complete len:203 (+) Transcript_38023:594-1202(+)
MYPFPSTMLAWHCTVWSRESKVASKVTESLKTLFITTGIVVRVAVRLNMSPSEGRTSWNGSGSFSATLSENASAFARNFFLRSLRDTISSLPRRIVIKSPDIDRVIGTVEAVEATSSLRFCDAEGTSPGTVFDVFDFGRVLDPGSVIVEKPRAERLRCILSLSVLKTRALMTSGCQNSTLISLPSLAPLMRERFDFSANVDG